MLLQVYLPLNNSTNNNLELEPDMQINIIINLEAVPINVPT